MQYFLAKTEPHAYSINNLEKEKVTTWNGIKNPQAVKALKVMKKGDRVLIYHSGGEAAIRGLAEVVGKSRPDPKNEKSWLVDFKFIRKFNEPYITLKDIKGLGEFNSLSLVKQGRLSTMEMPKKFIDWLKLEGLNL